MIWYLLCFPWSVSWAAQLVPAVVTAQCPFSARQVSIPTEVLKLLSTIQIPENLSCWRRDLNTRSKHQMHGDCCPQVFYFKEIWDSSLEGMSYCSESASDSSVFSYLQPGLVGVWSFFVFVRKVRITCRCFFDFLSFSWHSALRYRFRRRERKYPQKCFHSLLIPSPVSF